jgi:predicted nucleic acid-binding protein
LTALDTSVVIAAFAPWHESHETARTVVTPEAVISAHVVTETYAVLTRMPAPFRNLDCHCISGRLKYRFPSI